MKVVRQLEVWRRAGEPPDVAHAVDAEEAWFVAIAGAGNAVPSSPLEEQSPGLQLALGLHPARHGEVLARDRGAVDHCVLEDGQYLTSVFGDRERENAFDRV